MKRILVVTGSRADFGLLEWPIKVLLADTTFSVDVLRIWGLDFAEAFKEVESKIHAMFPDIILILGDRYEILAAATAAHLNRTPIAHIAGGDITEGSYDDAMRDAISRMATIHFVTSTSAMARLSHHGYRNIHLVGNPSIDVIKDGAWKKERPFPQPYVVVSYQAETIDGTNDIFDILRSLPDELQVFIYPNPDAGNLEIRRAIKAHIECNPKRVAFDYMAHGAFLNLIYHADEFIGNSSAMLYEAPELGVKCRMIGKRQRGRTIPWGDGNASERIAKILRYTVL